MKLDEHRRMLLALLKKTGALKVAEVRKRTHLSANTIERDLDGLAAAGYLIRVPGGAVPVMKTARPSRLCRLPSGSPPMRPPSGLSPNTWPG